MRSNIRRKRFRNVVKLFLTFCNATNGTNIEGKTFRFDEIRFKANDISRKCTKIGYDEVNVIIEAKWLQNQNGRSKTVPARYCKIHWKQKKVRYYNTLMKHRMAISSLTKLSIQFIYNIVECRIPWNFSGKMRLKFTPYNEKSFWKIMLEWETL